MHHCAQELIAEYSAKHSRNLMAYTHNVRKTPTCPARGSIGRGGEAGETRDQRSDDTDATRNADAESPLTTEQNLIVLTSWRAYCADS